MQGTKIRRLRVAAAPPRLVVAGHDVRTAVALAPLTAGEWVQGALAGCDFLVSCPINIYSRAQAWVEIRSQVEVARPLARPGVGVQMPLPSAPGGSPEVHLLPPLPPGGGEKARLAALLALRKLGIGRACVWLRVETPLPAGKGLGTSTADILAAAQAVALALGRPFSPQELARLALSIEPTDSSMFPGLAILDHRRGSRFVLLMGAPPPLRVLLLDLGGQVDTVRFNAQPDLAQKNAEKEPQVLMALQTLERGLRQSSPQLLADAATISALAHQRVLPKPGLEALLDAAQGWGALGVVNAHSGTVIGILWDGGVPAEARLKEKVLSWLASKAGRAFMPGARMLATTQITGGGVMGWVQPSRLHSRPDRGPSPAGGPQGSEADV